MFKVPRLWFLALCVARDTNHGDLALGSAPGYAQSSIHRWLMAIIFERETQNVNGWFGTGKRLSVWYGSTKPDEIPGYWPTYED